MSAQTQREAGRVLLAVGCISVVLWWIAAAIYCATTHTWDRPLNELPDTFAISMGSWSFSMLLGGVWWLRGWRATRRPGVWRGAGGGERLQGCGRVDSERNPVGEDAAARSTPREMTDDELRAWALGAADDPGMDEDTYRFALRVLEDEGGER